jgi:hypothetical protein
MVTIYSVINKNSDSAAVITALFQTLHDDIQQATKEIWFSIKDVTKHISLTINIVKILELLVIGIFLACLPEVGHFFVKTFMKFGKI